MAIEILRFKSRKPILPPTIAIVTILWFWYLPVRFTQDNARKPRFRNAFCNHVPRLRHEHTFLDRTSMWAMGADARTIPPRRRKVPLVAWDDRAVARLRSEWHTLQWSTPCDRAIYIYPHFWGITSQMRDVGDAAVVALAFNRPLRVVEDAQKPRWCEADAWLGCFFGLVAGSTCNRTQRDLSQALPKPVVLQDSASGSALPISRSILAGPGPLHMGYDAQFTFILDDSRFFPTQMWLSMIDNGLVCFRDGENRIVDARDLMARNPRLFHTVSMSALRTMLVSVIFRPHKEIAHEAQRKYAQHQAESAYCAALHLRWTDKQTDGGAAASLAPSVDHVQLALSRIRKRLGYLPTCLLVATDDDRRAIPMLKKKLGPKFRVASLSQTSSLLNVYGYSKYAALGHNYFASRAASTSYEARAEAFRYFRATIVDALAASHARVLIGVGSSGFSQLVAQHMGADRQSDGNAFAVWQEDLVKLDDKMSQ